MNMDTTRGKVLAKASTLVHGSRNRDYGPPEENFQRIAVMWNAYIAGKEALTASDVCMMMCLLKISRVSHQVDADGFVDLAGYAALGAECAAIYIEDGDWKPVEGP
jgi:hypothetical protein